MDTLRKIAKIRNVSLSTITGEIINDYLHKNTFIQKYDSIRDGKKFISTAFEHLDPSVFDKIASIDAYEFIRGAKMNLNDFSLENILSSFRGWIGINKLKLGEFEENERIRWKIETKMGKNYNEITANSFKKVLDEFGFSANVESFCEDDFEIIFLNSK